ncbi:MAG: hypothetical protein IJL55_07225 [Lachnospiraceae bacterium]|nr:hypothetical protein [Lachnospiraceae bacterium]
MKKFFKALALVLALTLVVGTIPASAAELDFSLKKEKKIIYLGGASGEKEVDGETIKCGTKSRYKVSKLVNGFDPETMDIQLESSDKSIVKTSNAKDKVYAKAIGTADVTIYVIDKETDKQLKDLTLKVQVKKNAAAVTAIITDAEGNLVDLTATKAGVNVPYIVTLPRKDMTGAFVDTDYRTLTAADESVQIEAANKYGTQYKVTFTKAGTFALTAASYQSKIWNKLQNVVTVPVTAGYDAADAAQYSLDTAVVSFDTPVAGLTPDNFKAVYTLDGVDDVEIPFADIAPDGISYNEDKTAAYVKFLMPFAANTNYIIYFDGKVAGNFKAVEVKADSVKTFVIPTQYVTVDTEAKIKYQLLDATGVDITDGVNAVGGNVTFEITSDDANDYIIGDTIYVKTAHAVTVTGTYHYFDSESNYKNEPVGKGQVVAQTPEAYKVGRVEGIITNASEVLVTNEYKLNDKAKAVDWTLDGVDNDGSAIAYLQIKVPYTKSSGTVYEGFGVADADSTYDSYEIDIADKTVALFEGFSGNMAKLSANKEGSTSILVYGVKADKKVVIGVVPVTVKGARKLTTWAVSGSADKLNLDFGSVKYTVTVKDQEGNDFVKEYKLKVEDATDANNVKVLVAEKAYKGKAEIEITADMIKDITGAQANAVTRNIKFTVTGDNNAKTVRLSVKSDGTDAARYLLKLNGNEIKTGIKTDTVLNPTDGSNKVTLTLEGLTSNGTAAPVASGVALKFRGTAVKAYKNEDDGAANNTYVFTVTKDGKLLDAIPDQLTGVVFNAFAAGKTASDDAAKLDKGTYVVNAYRFYLNSSKSTYVYDNVGSAQTFTVTDDQASIEWKKTKEVVDSFDPSDVVGAFEIKIGGNAVKYGDAGYEFTVVVNEDKDATTAYVKSIVVKVLNDEVGSYKYTITPDVLLKK